MKEFMVSLDVITFSLPPEDVSRMLETEHWISRDLGNRTLWRVKSSHERKAALVEQIETILKNPFVSQVLRHSDLRIETAYINVGVTHESVTCTIEITSECIELISEYSLGILVSCYPLSETLNSE
jgi:hypothetical protein